MKEDPLVLALAEAGSLDAEYLRMCNLVQNRSKAKEIPDDCELKQVEGLLEELKVVEMSTGASILVRNDEFYVPQREREHMLDVLHLGHHSAETKLRNCRG